MNAVKPVLIFYDHNVLCRSAASYAVSESLVIAKVGKDSIKITSSQDQQSPAEGKGKVKSPIMFFLKLFPDFLCSFKIKVYLCGRFTESKLIIYG